MPQDPNDPNDFTDQYNTPIPPDKQAAFNQYVQQQTAAGKNPLNDRYDYDVQGDWLSTQGARDARGHATDTFKKPNHTTFSTGSRYNGVNGNQGGQWMQAPGGSWVYQPSATVLKHHSEPELQDYFANEEQGSTLAMPPSAPQVNMQQMGVGDVVRNSIRRYRMSK